jgi:hypothetical protein
MRDLLRSVDAYEASLQRSTTHWPIGWKDADNRGAQLLIRNLSPAQREQYEVCGYFEVTGGVTGKRYRIRRGHQMNIEELDQKGRRVHFLCFSPEGSLPVADVMLAQKIALETFESDAIRVAHCAPMWDDSLAADMRIARRFAHHRERFDPIATRTRLRFASSTVHQTVGLNDLACPSTSRSG